MEQALISDHSGGHHDVFEHEDDLSRVIQFRGLRCGGQATSREPCAASRAVRSLPDFALHFVTTFTSQTGGEDGSIRYNVAMNATPLLSLSTDTYERVLSLIPDVPWVAMPRAALLAGSGDIYMDDPVRPAAAAIAVPGDDGASLFLCGDPDSADLAAFVHARSGPNSIHATDAIAARMPAWRPDATSYA